MDVKLKAEIVEQVIKRLNENNIFLMEPDFKDVPISVSGRHLHLSRKDMDVLFGEESKLTVFKPISQPGQFASNERVTIVGPRGQIDNLRVLGPLRKETQIELAASDARRIGIKLPVRASGDLDGTPGITIIGPKGSIVVSRGCIIAERHIHMTPEQAKQRGVEDGQQIQVRVDSEKGGIMDQVFVHIRKDFAYDMHVDSDDANAFLISPDAIGKMLI